MKIHIYISSCILLVSSKFCDANVDRENLRNLCVQHTPLNSPGIYIRTLIPDGPAASDGRLHIGDRILAVNGKSLIGADYQRFHTRVSESPISPISLTAAKSGAISVNAID